ncbi:hypothetical protein F8M41_008742 [Gigaspora margarita]|uniref:Uncharacterized protein n=1 Tax=Gigaspora margarita TaxID=4874 RepID=A0A8H3X3U7_GIGMA|nr:hypothetical protein F8M41_008742 [Gigaspora margarita]
MVSGQHILKLRIIENPGWGLTEKDYKNGINTIEAKLEDIYPYYGRIDAIYFENKILNQPILKTYTDYINFIEGNDNLDNIQNPIDDDDDNNNNSNCETEKGDLTYEELNRPNSDTNKRKHNLKDKYLNIKQTILQIEQDRIEIEKEIAEIKKHEG